MAKRILVVDDSATVRQQVKLALTQAGFEVVEAIDGQDGVTKITSSNDISAVICDVNMPRKSGIELLEEVKSKPQYNALPILMLTTEGQPALVKRAKAAGASGWVVKPFKANLLISAVEKLTA
jgi:two-component system, chemotaxis family, chemotaxis protein CheY